MTLSRSRQKSRSLTSSLRRWRRRSARRSTLTSDRRRHFETLENRLLLAVFTPSKDNTLFENAAGASSNGAGQYLYAGMTNQASDPRRRAVVAFDLTSIPAGSTVTAASLSMLVTRNPMESLALHDFGLHRLTSDWGEGTSSVGGAGGLGTAATTGDATWIHTSFNTANWMTPGGDFLPTASATTSAGNDGATATWSSAGLIADVQAWVNSPGDNYGWIVIGQEGTPKTARRFFSKEGATPPALDVTFTPAANTPAVTVVNPQAGSHGAPGSTNVAATFSQDINGATAAPTSFVVHASQSGQLAGSAVTVSTSGATVTLDPASDFHAGELVQATATSAISSVGGQAVEPHVWQFRAAAAAGSGVFNDGGQTLGVAANNTNSFALSLGDLDNDGDLDMFVANDTQGSRVYLNDGNGAFSDSGQSLGSTSSRDVALGDIDGDGDLDAVVANTASQGNRIWQNNGSGVFVEFQSLGNSSSHSVKLGDLDGDGDMDAFFANSGANRVWLNSGGVLSDSGQSLGNHNGRGVALGDLDGDGDLDAFVGNLLGASDRVWFNDGSGTFSESGQALGNPALKSSRDVVLGDVDSDGDVDAFVVGRGYNNRLFLNNGSGTFTDSGQVIDAPVNPFFEYGATMGDVDADGDLDIVTSGEAIAHWNRLFLNDGAGAFTESGQVIGGQTYGVDTMGTFGIELGDLDSDGDLDVAFANGNTFPNINSTTRVWLNQNLTPNVTLGIDSPQIAEAAGVATVTATLSAAHTQVVTVDLGLSGTATNTVDYAASATQIVIAAGATNGSVTITAVQDADDEPDETVIVDIASVVNGQETGTQQVTTTIVDDDEPAPIPEVTLSLDNATVLEAGGVATFTANLSVATTVPVTVDLEIAGTAAAADFTASGTQITVAPGATSGTITVTAVQDALDEPNETVVVTVSSVTNGTVLGLEVETTQIIDDDPEPTVELAVDDATIAEAGGVATLTASLSAPSSRDVAVDLHVAGSAANGLDYTISAAQAAVMQFSSADFTTTPVFSDVQTFAFDIDLAVPLAPGSYANPAMNELDYRVSGTLVPGTPSGFSSFALSRSFTDAAFYLQGSSLDFEIAATADLSDGLQISELAGPDPVFVFNGREVGTGRFHPALLELNSNGTGRIQNSNNAPSGTPIAFGAEYITNLVFDPAVLTIAQVHSRLVIPAGSTKAMATVTAVQDTIDEPDETVIAEVADVRNGQEAGTQEVTVTIIDDDVPPSFVVTSLDATDSGFRVAFNNPLDSGDLNLYDTQNAGLGAADVSVVGASSGPISGSLVVAESSVEFIKTGDPLAADTYTVTLRSATDGFEDTAAMLLDGNADGAGGDDYVNTFTVAAAPVGARTLRIPDFVRGPGQDVNLPADGTTGIPISISDGENVRAVDLRISYDPAMLQITGATAPAGGTVVVNTTTPGLAILVYFATAALPAGESTFVNLQANVPTENASAIYRGRQVLDVHEVIVGDGNDTEFPAVVDDAFHLATNFADVSGNGRINASDAAQVARFAALIDNGFAASLNTDPTIVGDISGNGRINAADASRVAQFAALIPVPEIPPVPGGVVINGVFDPLEFGDVFNDVDHLAARTPPALRAPDPLGFEKYSDTLREARSDTTAVTYDDAIRVESVFHQRLEDLLDDDLAHELALDWLSSG